MSTHLTAGQHALLEAELLQRLRALDRRLDDQLGGQSRAEHAREVLQQDGDDAPQRDAEREVDLALSDRSTQAQAELGAALQRLRAGADARGPRYGQCADCAADIPFDRLRADPAALRCVACATRHEGAARPAATL